jgi:hypothetical protein
MNVTHSHPTLAFCVYLSFVYKVRPTTTPRAPPTSYFARVGTKNSQCLQQFYGDPQNSRDKTQTLIHCRL